MIDKSIRQYYQNGKKAGPFKRGIKTIWDPIKKKYIDPLVDTTTGKLDKKLVAETIPEVAEFAGKSFLKREAAKKLGLTSLNPLLGLLSLVMPWIKDKWGEGGVEQAYTSGIMGPKWADLQDRELRQLEKRREYMLKRKADKKTYSKKNLEEVTNQIKEIKKTRNVIEEVTADDPFAWPEPKDSPISQFPGEDEIILQQRKQEAMFPGEDEIILQQRKQEAMFPGENEIVQQQRERDEAIKREEQFEAQRIEAELQREVTRQAEAEAERRRQQQSPVQWTPAGGNGGGGRDYGHQETRSSSGWERSPFKKGGRIDKSLTGRSRDI